MKVFLLTSTLIVAALCPALAQFTNSTPFTSPPSAYPQIDSTNFVNLSSFVIDNTSLEPFTSSDVLYWTNRGTLNCDTGFIFDDEPSGSGTNRPSGVFGNSSIGVIYGGTGEGLSIYNGLGQFGIGFSPELTVWATNVVNNGLMDVGVAGVIQIMGNNVSLARGTLQVEGFTDYSTTAQAAASPNIGIFDNLYGIGMQTNGISAATLSTNLGVSSPPSTVTIVGGRTETNFLVVSPPNASAYAWVDQPSVSNVTIQVVFVNTNLPGISVDVRRAGGGGTQGFGVPFIQWQAIITNNSGLPTLTNNLYLADHYGVQQTNYLVQVGQTFSYVPEFAPFNYDFTNYSQVGFSSFSPPNTPYNAQTFFGGFSGETNAYSAYEVFVEPVAFENTASALGPELTNLPGRIQISASSSLDLTLTKISGPSYVDLSSSNHFVGATNALIISPLMDINLGSTNGNLSISNVIYPNVPRFTGQIDLYSARWTNVDSSGNTNTFHILIADGQLVPTYPAAILNLALHSTNILVGDVLNVYSNAQVSGTSLTITTNGPNAPSTNGEINLFYTDSDWSTAFANLQNLTNFGLIDVSGGTFFDSVPSNRPYASFVNHGTITDGATSIQASYAENSYPVAGGALIDVTGGTFSLQASNAVLYNSLILSLAGDLSITSGSLFISNETLTTGGALTFAITNALTDGNRTSINTFQASDGLNLLVKPATGDFLNSVVTLAAPASQIVYNTWAGTNAGKNPAGFHNNAAVGELILSAGDAYSQFQFSGPDNVTNYALYVDLISLQNGATNRSNVGGTQTFNAFSIAPNVTIYFADALVGNNDISEKLDGANGGQLIWVPAYAGRFSSTNLVYPAGVTNTFNRGLVESTDIDSDADGIVNAFDLTPIYTANSVNFSVTITNLPPKVPALHWNLLGNNASNIVYYSTNLSKTNWTFLTNIMTSGLTIPNYTFIDRSHTNGSTFYKLQIDAVQP